MERIRLSRPSLARRAIVGILCVTLAATLAAGSAHAGDALKRGRAAFLRSDFPAAVPLLQQAVSEEPGNIDAHATLAQALIKTHQYDAGQGGITAAAKLS